MTTHATTTQPITELMLLVIVVGWPFVLSRFLEGNVYATAGPYALVAMLILVALRGRTVATWLEPSRTAIISGLAAGAGMTLLTYPAYEIASMAWPGLTSRVDHLYTGAAMVGLGQAVPWTFVILAAEELIWRGCLLDALERRMPRRWAAAAAVATYALAQLGTGSAIVAVMALACGTLWTLQRMWTRSLLAPLIAHAIWTPTVILLHPVTS